MLDLLIKNGHVIDPANRTDQVGNIAIYNGRITRYEEGEPARHVVDAAGKYVFPGLIDAHAHMFQEGTEIGIYPVSYTHLAEGPGKVKIVVVSPKMDSPRVPVRESVNGFLKS